MVELFFGGSVGEYHDWYDFTDRFFLNDRFNADVVLLENTRYLRQDSYFVQGWDTQVVFGFDLVDSQDG